MEYFCTLFDSNYLLKGLAMYYSLRKCLKDFRLYIITFDDKAYDYLTRWNFPDIIPISLSDFEDERLLRIKKTRNNKEYCWTCGCFSIKYVLERFQLPRVTYLDADLFFYDTPDRIFEELDRSGKSVLITEHDYTPKYDVSKRFGKYCVQFMTFVNDRKGTEVLNWWCDRCEEWCYDRDEDGKFGDQKYLDDWEERFDCVHVLQDRTLAVAPWNVQRYSVSRGPLFDGKTQVFYHFHGLNAFDGNIYKLCVFKLTHDDIQYIYLPYIKVLQHIRKLIREKWDPDFECGIMEVKKEKKHIKESLLHPTWFIKSRKIVMHLAGTYNVIHVNDV